MKSNEQLQKDVQDAIKWEPLLHAAEIGVTAKDGVVTLTGIVDSYVKKSEVEDAAKNVAGVKAVVEKIEIKFNSLYSKKDDTVIAADVLRALEADWQIPADKIKVKVEKGWITLDGEVEWKYQSDVARNVVKQLIGVTGVANNIKIKPTISEAIEKEDIERALWRNASIDERDIKVNVTDHKATLTGTVHSIYEKDEAARVAWNARGIWEVVNDLLVEYDYELVD